ncbi:AAA family ATPase [Colletotrichum plurivorum]|uniref:AAA family ATPase n=1 Tax=Colletotrichum plurivorum TaxID=2175906 RepID=A0A8H6N2M3_9PEZI|nr:AAA family ATPase [Colletotrichum plurivorum]
MTDIGPDSAPPGPEEATTVKRFARVDEVYSLKDRQVHLIKTPKAPKVPRKAYRYAFLIKRHISLKGVVARISVELNSLHLIRVLRDDVFAGIQSLGLHKQTPQLSRQDFWHAKPGLTKRLETEKARQAKGKKPSIEGSKTDCDDANETPDQALVKDIQAALDFLQEDFAEATADLDALSRKGLITFDLLWTLFPPNTDVYTDQNQLCEPQVLRFVGGGYRSNEQTGDVFYEITATCLNHSGRYFGWAEMGLKISQFEGNQPITSLAVHPLSCREDADQLRDHLRSRGHKYVRLLTQPTCCDYSAEALTMRATSSAQEVAIFTATRRVMVDPINYSEYSSDSLCYPQCARSKAFSPAKTDPTDMVYCHYYILGYSFAETQWCALAVSKLIDPPAWDRNAFDKVLMPPTKRDLIHRLVLAHSAGSDEASSFKDIIRDKGESLVGLLSGDPGVGKTLTAEAVAEVTQRPLLSVGSGELGAELREVDRQLKRWLMLASAWRSVLLIDECDVFLRKRDQTSLVNNALVSIFLRRLEYFKGVAILTTNRKTDIDGAFMSRIHFKFHFDNLGSKERLELWKTFAGEGVHLDEEKLAILAQEMELNGREIRNVVFCAKLLSKTEDPPGDLTVDMLTRVAKDLTDFRDP